MNLRLIVTGVSSDDIDLLKSELKLHITLIEHEVSTERGLTGTEWIGLFVFPFVGTIAVPIARVLHAWVVTGGRRQVKVGSVDIRGYRLDEVEQLLDKIAATGIAKNRKIGGKKKRS